MGRAAVRLCPSAGPVLKERGEAEEGSVGEMAKRERERERA
jgi:hypothetical protein